MSKERVSNFQGLTDLSPYHVGPVCFLSKMSKKIDLIHSLSKNTEHRHIVHIICTCTYYIYTVYFLLMIVHKL